MRLTFDQISQIFDELEEGDYVDIITDNDLDISTAHVVINENTTNAYGINPNGSVFAK